MNIQEEIRKIIKENKEALYDIYCDTIITYIKLLLNFPKQINERKLFLKHMIQFKYDVIEENNFLNSLINANIVDQDKIDEIIDDLDLTFETIYLYYDEIIAYMEKSIDNRILNFSNNAIKESIMIQKIKNYKKML